MVDLNSEAVPIALFGAALAGKPFVPINYRLTDEQLRDLVGRTAPATVIIGEGVADRLGPIPGIELIERKEFLDRTADPSVEEADPYAGDPDSVAVLLYTSGTTGAPKAAVLRNRNLTSYVISTVEFAGAGEDEAAVVSVPPYHIAGISSVLSSTYSGRRVVHLETFEPRVWVDVVRAEAVTHAMVVPTMLNRILDVVAEDDGGLPSLRSLSYGGGPMPLAVIERAMALLPGVGFVNAYGLTETASTIALLGPDDHREAHASDGPRTSGPAWRRWADRSRPSRWRSGTWTARCWARVHGARSGSGASRWRGSTRGSVAARTTAGSTPATRATSTTAASSSCTAGWTTSSCAVARTSRRGRSRRCCSSTPPSPPRRSWASPTPTGGRRSSPPWCPLGGCRGRRGRAA